MPLHRLTTVTPAHIEALADLLIDCVHGGASVSFMAPLSREKAMAFWQGVANAVHEGRRVLLVTDDGEGITGTVQLVLDLPENQPHRADVSKMLVLQRARRQGLGEQLMQGAEQAARDLKRSVLVLDTASADAERLYERLGWIRCGTVPGFALLPTGEPCATTFFYRLL